MNATLAITKKKLNVPTGTVPASFRFQVSGPVGALPAQDEPLTASQSVFVGLPPGAYTATCVTLSNQGTPLGFPVSASFIVPDPGINIDVPDVLTVTLA